MQQQIKYDFPERQHEERLEMSQEDHMLMESVSKSLKLVDGHYSIGLPLRNRDTEFSEFSRDYTRNLLSLWPTLKPCSIRSEYQRKTLTSCGFYGGLAEMLKRSWRSIRWSCTYLELHPLQVVLTSLFSSVQGTTWANSTQKLSQQCSETFTWMIALNQ